jgi:predicted N-formylglutamate amidohydrolase
VIDGVAQFISGNSGTGLLLVADHASNRVPEGIDLGIADHLFDEHIAFDIGVEPLSKAVAQRLGCPAILATVSRLVVDLNRDPEDPAAIPACSDGYAIPANAGLSEVDRSHRIGRYWHPYHALIAAKLEELQPRMLFNLHSFTPQLASRPHEQRPWEVGILYNQDDRAARIAISRLRAEGVVTGDNEPYSGLELNATMNRHAEARGMPYLGIEVRQDLISDAEGVARWAERLIPVIEETARVLG